MLQMDRRQEIIEAAAKSFTLFGYKATTMEQVAKIANVGKGTIYTFFANKEILFQEIAMSLVREMKAEADAVLDASASFMDNAHNALMKMLQFREKHLLFAKLIEEEKENVPEPAQYVLCPCCGFPIYDDEEKCSNCGTKREDIAANTRNDENR